MDKSKILDIVKNIENKSNKDLLEVEKFLEKEFETTKDIVINLTRHMESVEFYYNQIDKELRKRNIRL